MTSPNIEIRINFKPDRIEFSHNQGIVGWNLWYEKDTTPEDINRCLLDLFGKLVLDPNLENIKTGLRRVYGKEDS